MSDQFPPNCPALHCRPESFLFNKDAQAHPAALHLAFPPNPSRPKTVPAPGPYHRIPGVFDGGLNRATAW